MRRMKMGVPAFSSSSSSSSASDATRSSSSNSASSIVLLLLSSSIATARAFAPPPPTNAFSSHRKSSGGITRVHSSAAAFVDADVRVPPSSSLAGPYDDAPAAVATASMGDDVVASDAPDRAIIPSSVISSPSPPRAGALMKMLPPQTWVVSTPISLMYFAIDVLAVVSSMSFLHGVVNSDAYHASPLVGKFAMALPLQILTGFAMWCTWCIGHDAGHGTVSKSRKYGNAINRIVGEVCHSAICLTPFVPWRLSHRKHHLNHNHIDRDYSHQWYVREESADLHPLIGVAHATRMILFPFLYFFYLVAGVPDGGHVFFYGRMWDGHELKEKVDASLSVMTSFVTSGCLWHAMGTHDFALVCMMPWMVMSFWLFMVTYLQHHSSDGRLYTDDTFTFERGAFETVDRNYGKWVNRMSHHMMDGHVVHHLFFTKVPHYRLESATRALRTGMAELGMEGMYKRVDTPDYSQEIVRQFHDNWFFIDEDRVVR